MVEDGLSKVSNECRAKPKLVLQKSKQEHNEDMETGRALDLIDWSSFSWPDSRRGYVSLVLGPAQ